MATRSGSRAASDLQVHTSPFLKIAEDAKQIPRLRIATRSEHADQALGLGARGLAELLEADGGLDVVAQDRLAGVHVAGKHDFDALAQTRLAKGRILGNML